MKKFLVGRPKGSKNTPEVIARIAQSAKNSSFRRKESKRSSSYDIQSSSGYAGLQDYSTFSMQGYSKHTLWEERGNGWWGYDD